MTCRSDRITTLAELAEAIAAQRESLAHAVMRAARAEMPGYAAITDEAVLAEITAIVARAYGVLSASLARGQAALDGDFVLLESSAARRARQDVSLADYMHAMRIKQRVMWRAITEWAVDKPGGRDVALEAAGLLMELIHRGGTAAAQEYLDTEQFLAAERDRVRRDLLEDLLAGRRPAPGPRLAAATTAGLNPDTPCAVVVAVPVAAVDDEHGLRSAASLLGRAIGDPSRMVNVVRQDEIVIVRALPGGMTGVPADPVRVAWRTLADQGMRLAIGISTRYATVAEVGKAYRETVALLGNLRREGGVLALSDLSVLDYLMLRADGTAERIVPAAVRNFVTEDAQAGGPLITTVQRYAANDLNVKATARQLRIHINTAHHRLARVEERTGCDLRRLADLQELLIAIRLFGGDAVADT